MPMTPVTPATPEPVTQNADDQQLDTRQRAMLGRLDRSKTRRKTLIPDWSINIDYRRGKCFASETDQDRVAVNWDWSATKAKQAQMFSQVPQVRLEAKEQKYKPGVQLFQRKVNDVVTRARVGVALDECMPDVINAAGVAACIVAYESLQADATLPALSPAVAAFQPPAPAAPPLDPNAPPDAAAAPAAAPGAPPAPPATVNLARPVNYRYTCSRISPADLLTPDKNEFIGSDFDDAPWIGRSGRATWTDAQRRFKLTDAQRTAALTEDSRTAEERLTSDLDSERNVEPNVEYDEMFYWRYLFHPEEKSYEAIQHMVFVAGVKQPVIDDLWKGQRRADDGITILGSCKFPLRLLTLTYLTDESIPPSDTAMGRYQVDEMIRFRSLVLQQRETSLPMRWMDVNRVDTLIQDSLLRGTWNKIIPTNGDGSRAIGEVARATMPPDDYRGNDVAKGDLQETWQVSPSQMGSQSGPQIRSASEAGIIQQNFQTRIGYERGRVVKFFCGVAEVLAGLMCVMQDFTQEESGQFAKAGWDLANVGNYYYYNVRADASVLLDAQQRFDRLDNFLNKTGKSGFVNVQPILSEMASLVGLDPEEVIISPEPKAPEPVNISVRISGAADLQDPLMLALLMKTGQAPSPEEIEAAKRCLQAAGGPPQGAPPAPGVPPPPSSTPPPIDDAHPAWDELSRINKRTGDGK